MPLTLSRNVGQSLAIGDAIVTIKSNKGGRVMLSIDAPKSVRILRTELKDGEQEAATDAVGVDGSTSATEVKA